MQPTFNGYPQSEKIYLSGKIYPIRVPFRKINLHCPVPGDHDQKSRDSSLLVYDTSGFYGEKPFHLQEPPRLPRIRDSWSRHRQAAGKTQLYQAKAGIITPEMEFVAIRETNYIDQDHPVADNFISPEFVRHEIAEGRAILPSNPNHPECEPMILGSRFRVKVNANIGHSSLSSSAPEELSKAIQAIYRGADTIMDLSTGDSIAGTREQIIRHSPVPTGTVPLYEAFEKAGGKLQQLSWELFRETLLEQAMQGVDYFTIHAGLLREHVATATRRLTGIVSRGGAIMAQWCTRFDRENFLYTHFEEICAILKENDISLSLGDGLRPGSIYDANDRSQFQELEILGKLAGEARKADVQVMIEGPGHVPLNKLRENMEQQEKYCQGSPFYVLGPLTTDIAPGYDHITSAIGGAAIGMMGAAMLCDVTPKEHLGLPDEKDICEAVTTYKLAAHAADLAKGFPGARLRDDAMSNARYHFNWADQFALSLDPWKAREFREGNAVADDKGNTDHFCTMCGEAFCSMRTSHELRHVIEGRQCSSTGTADPGIC